MVALADTQRFEQTRPNTLASLLRNGMLCSSRLACAVDEARNILGQAQCSNDRTAAKREAKKHKMPKVNDFCCYCSLMYALSPCLRYSQAPKHDPPAISADKGLLRSPEGRQDDSRVRMYAG